VQSPALVIAALPPTQQPYKAALATAFLQAYAAQALTAGSFLPPAPVPTAPASALAASPASTSLPRPGESSGCSGVSAAGAAAGGGGSGGADRDMSDGVAPLRTRLPLGDGSSWEWTGSVGPLPSGPVAPWIAHAGRASPLCAPPAVASAQPQSPLAFASATTQAPLGVAGVAGGAAATVATAGGTERLARAFLMQGSCEGGSGSGGGPAPSVATQTVLNTALAPTLEQLVTLYRRQFATLPAPDAGGPTMAVGVASSACAAGSSGAMRALMGTGNAAAEVARQVARNSNDDATAAAPAAELASVPTTVKLRLLRLSQRSARD